MANIQILPQDFELSKSSATTITLGTKDTYVLEDIDVVVKPHIGSFNNQATTGVTYTENTTDATVIPSGGYLYLNQGWFDNTKISLGHLIPEIASNDAGVSHILSGYKAYDEAGNLITGTMATVDPKFDGGGLSVTPSVNSLTAPKVTVDSSGTFKTATSYGVTSTAPSGTDGTNYLTIDGKASVTTKGSVKASATATRTAVLYNGAYTGYLDKADDTQVLATANMSKASDASEIDVTITDSFKPLYIPIVSVTGKGGGLSKASSGNSVSITGTNPTITLTYGGKFTDTTGASYGVTTTEPTTGEDGTDFLKVGVGGTSDIQTFTGDATIVVDRAVVTNDGLKRGAINIADGAKLLGAGSGTFTHSNTRTVTASLSNDKAYYIPIIKSMPVKGGAMTQASSSVEINGNNPTVTISNSGSFTDVASGGVGASYGVTTTAPTGTDGTNFLKITIDGTSDSQTFTGASKIYVNRAAVTHNGAAAGAIKWANGSSILDGVTNQAFSATTDTNSERSVTATVNGGTSYYIPIVNLTNKGTGGSVTASATANVDIVKPKVNYTPTGTVTTNLDSLGVSHSPFTGSDGSEYYSLVITPTATSDGSVSGTVSGSWSRTAVKSNGTYQGAVSLTTSTQFLAAGSGTITSAETSPTSIGVDFTSVTDDDKKWYFKRAKVKSNGGDLETAELGITGDAPTVTPDINFKSRTGTTDGAAITLSTYGITETTPSSGSWVVFDPTGTSNSATFTGSVTAARSSLTISVSKGLTGDASSIVERATKKYTNTRTFAATVAAGKNRYIPVQAVTASVSSHSVTNPTVDYSESAGYYISGVKQNSVPSGILLAQTSNPSDFSTKKYIKIEPSGGVTQGSSKTTATGSISAGITAGGNDTKTSTQSIGVTSGTTKSCFIKVYDGGYIVS